MRIAQTGMFAFSLLLSVNSFCQTISPIYIESDSIDLPNIKFINNSNGTILKSKIEGHLVHINDILPPEIKMILPFKDGTVITLDTVETKYFYGDCVISTVYVPQHDTKWNECSRVTYHLGCRIIFGKTFCSSGNRSVQVDIGSNVRYYTLTKGMNLDHKKRWKLFRKNMKRRFPGYQF